jgi:hypothetical protein
MWDGLRAWWQGLRHFEHRGYIYIWANVFWFVLSLPLITAPAAWAGLMYMSHRAYYSPSANVNDFWEGFKSQLKPTLPLVFVNFFFVGFGVGNFWLYRGQTGPFLDLLRVIWLIGLIGWLTVQLYLWPLYYEMAQPMLWGAVRNAVVMLLLNPGFTIGLWLGIALMLVLSTFFGVPWLLLTGSALAAVANSAVVNRLQVAGIRTKAVLSSPTENL